MHARLGGPVRERQDGETGLHSGIEVLARGSNGWLGAQMAGSGLKLAEWSALALE
jgi:hypothetical protein